MPALVVKINPDAQINHENLRALIGFPIVFEGGVGYGKSLLAWFVSQVLSQNRIISSCTAEPTDKEALEVFMRYQKEPPKSMPAEERLKWDGEAADAAVNMQFSMMDRRCDQMEKVAAAAGRGEAPILDRGPFGDDCFMITTFKKYHVSSEEYARYIAIFQKRYMRIKFPHNAILIVRLCTHPAVAFQRYLERDKPTADATYTMDYFEKLERMHEACSRGWDLHVIYDNSEVKLVSPKDEYSSLSKLGSEGVVCPERAAINSLLLTMCECARQLRAKNGEPPY
jgi:deoxyadenosine/deoxycytidine kinase